MLYFPFKLRESKNLVTPKGPSLNWAKRIRIDFSGSALSFTAPRHKPEFRINDPIFPERSYSLDSLPLKVDFAEEDAARGRRNPFRRRDIFYRAWAFCGPWFTGVLAELHLTVTLFRPVGYPQSFSLFHPRALEMVIGDYLDYRYADALDQTRDRMQQFTAPVNWRPLALLPVNAVLFEVIPSLPSAGTTTTEHLFFFPLADDLMVLFKFEPSRFKNLSNEEMDKRVNIQPMHDLMNSIINSIQLKLSPEAQAQQAKALEGLADTSLVKHFPPIKWDKLDEKTTEAILLEAKQGG
jgi:hypothetical protein